jgi:putative ABC transport system substrate-binding protein
VIDRRTFLGTLIGSLLAAPLVAEAEQARPGVPRIGLLSSGPTGGPDMAGFGRGLRDLGYVDGQNIVIEHRYAKSYDELPRLAAELLGLKVDVIFAQGSPSAQVARDSIHATPVVFTTFADPVRTRLVASLAHPGGNLTGLTMIAGELAGKRLQVIREILPRVSHVAVLLNPARVLARIGAPGGIRTPDPRLRRPMLYPTELQARRVVTIHQLAGKGPSRSFLKVP